MSIWEVLIYGFAGGAFGGFASALLRSLRTERKRRPSPLVHVASGVGLPCPLCKHVICNGDLITDEMAYVTCRRADR